MANYKTSWVQRLIEGAWQKTFAFAHAKTVYTDYANKKTLADKLSEIDTEIGNKANKTEIPTELPANGGNSATVNGHTVKSDVPENAVFTDTVYDYSALLGYDIYNLVSLKDATYPSNKKWLLKDFIAPFDGHVFFMVQTDATSGAFTQVLREDDVLVSNNQRNIADFNTWGEAYNHPIYKGKNYHFESYNNTATAFNKVMLCISKKGETPTEYVPYAPSNVALAEENTSLDKRISDNGYGEIAGGKNLANFSKLGMKTSNGITFEYQSNGSIKVFGTVSTDGNVYTPLELTKTRFSKGCWYTTSVKSSNPNTIAKVFFTNNGDTTTLQMSETADLYYYIQFVPTGSMNNNLTAGTVIDEVLYPQIEEGTAPTDYEPYFPSNKMLAEENIQQSTEIMDIKMLGWSVPRECPVQNEVNGNQFTQKVGRVDLGSLDWIYNNDNFKSSSLQGIAYSESNSKPANAYIDGYQVMPDSSLSGNKKFSISTKGNVYIKNTDHTDYTDVSAFKTAMQGKYLYYELATPITTTIDGNEIGETVSDVRKETTVNLFKPTLETTTRNGVTCTNNGDGTYTISGTSTAQVTFKLAVNVKVPTSCILTGCKGGSPTTYMFGVFDGTNYFEVYDIDNAKEIPANTYQYAYIVVRNGVTLSDNTIINPMITTNLNATYYDFVPYTGDSGSLNGDVAEKSPKANPVFTGSISIGRAKNSTIGEYSTAIGDFVDASGRASHSEGSLTTASGMNSHAEGENTTASGHSSHSEGVFTIASGNYSHAEGGRTVSLNYQHAGGHHNNTNTATDSKSSGTGTGTSFVIGNGTATSKSNAFRVDDNGTPYSKAGLNTTGADYAEFFEWEDGNENNEDRRGYFVTLDGKHIKIAKEGDWILGIVSGFPAIIGNGDEEWKGRYVFDDFGCPVIEEFEYEEEEYETITNSDGKEEVITKNVKKTGTKWKEVPEYDPTQPYTGRMQRKEWAAIGMLGVLSVRDDGSCKVNGFCKLADGGIATASDTGYRVVKRVTDNIVEVIFK